MHDQTAYLTTLLSQYVIIDIITSMKSGKAPRRGDNLTEWRKIYIGFSHPIHLEVYNEVF